MRPLILAFGCSNLCGCGAGLVGGQYPGQPLIVVVGEVIHDSPIGIEVTEPRIGLFWRGPEGFLGEQGGALTTNFPARYAFDIYLPPANGIVQDLPDESARGALGMLMLYQDEDQSASWAPGEPVIGIGNHAIAWFEVTPPELDVPTFSYVDTTPPCQVPEEEEAPPPGTIHADLTVAANACDVVPDMDCNPQTNEWPAVCE